MKKEPGNEEGQQDFNDADKLLQEFQEAQVDRVGSRPSSNLSSLSNASERDQHHLGKLPWSYVAQQLGECQLNVTPPLSCNIFIAFHSTLTSAPCFLLSTGSPSHLGVGDQSEMVHDPYEFLQSPEPESSANSWPHTHTAVFLPGC